MLPESRTPVGLIHPYVVDATPTDLPTSDPTSTVSASSSPSDTTTPTGSTTTADPSPSPSPTATPSSCGLSVDSPCYTVATPDSAALGVSFVIGALVVMLLAAIFAAQLRRP